MLCTGYHGTILDFGPREAHHIHETLFNSISLVLSAYFLYLIRYESTYRVKVYQLLLTVDAMLDLGLTFSYTTDSTGTSCFMAL